MQEKSEKDYAISDDFFERILQQEQEYRNRKPKEFVEEPLVCSMEEGCVSCGS